MLASRLTCILLLDKRNFDGSMGAYPTRVRLPPLLYSRDSILEEFFTE